MRNDKMCDDSNSRACVSMPFHADVVLPDVVMDFNPVMFCKGHKADHPGLLALGKMDELKVHSGTALPLLRAYLGGRRDWFFGSISYELKNEIERLSSAHEEILQFPILHFFRPEIVLCFEKGMAHAYYDRNRYDVREIIRLLSCLREGASHALQPSGEIFVHKRTSRQEYCERFNSILQHIKAGDVYELNYCQEFFAETELDVLRVNNVLNQLTPMPFSAFYRTDEKYLLCASPERYIQKKGNRIISQPIKGTIKRGESMHEDKMMRQRLMNNIKERGENVMIVDLVRNDLSRVSVAGSVKVDELFGIYSFPGITQMISTVSSELRQGTDFTDILKATFPMGSMTGAPKIRAMELIEAHEDFRRGLYAGSVGYITPTGDFDFNVVIRSILYNASLPYLSLPAGGAITSLSDPASEYAECLLKIQPMLQALGAEIGM